MPAAAPGIMTLSTVPSQSRRNAQMPTASCTIRIGSRIAAAASGEIASASIGIEMLPTPTKPPFESPSRITAGMATA
jgi:hypothetical protein